MSNFSNEPIQCRETLQISVLNGTALQTYGPSFYDRSVQTASMNSADPE